jgi:hypothetical protein
MEPVETESIHELEGIVALDTLVKSEFLPEDDIKWRTNGTVLEQCTTLEKLEEQPKALDLARKLKGFLMERWGNRGYGYDSISDIHTSGWDSAAEKIKDPSVEPGLLTVTIADSHVNTLHLRVDKSTCDWYISGRALDDFGKTLES